MILYSEVTGSGQPVLLLPGMLATTSFWKEIAKKLSSKFKVISLDLLGFGKSPAPWNLKYSISDHISSINETLVKNGINDPMIVVGHSMGSLVSFRNGFGKTGG